MLNYKYIFNFFITNMSYNPITLMLTSNKLVKLNYMDRKINLDIVLT